MYVLILGLLINAIALPIAGRRVMCLYRLITSGQPSPDRFNGETTSPATGLANVLTEVFGQRRLLKWTVPGLAHFFTFWAFVILASVYLEAYGSLFDPDFEIPLIGTWPVLGFLQDTIALLVAGRDRRLRGHPVRATSRASWGAIRASSARTSAVPGSCSS